MILMNLRILVRLTNRYESSIDKVNELEHNREILKLKATIYEIKPWIFYFKFVEYNTQNSDFLQKKRLAF